jgi:endoglucanase
VQKYHRHSPLKIFIPLVVVLLVAAIGTYLFVSSHAESPYASQEASSGSLTNPAVVNTNSDASDGKAVQFGSSSDANLMQGIAIGVDTYPSNETNAVSEIGRAPAIINEFVDWSGNGSPVSFPTSYANGIIALGSTPMLTWQPNLPSYTTTSVLTSITNGSEDSYITDWAKAAKAENHTVYVRLMHEFNGDWYPWGEVKAGVTPLSKNQLGSGNVSGTYPYTNTVSMYVAAYQHVVQLFQAAGATNVQFVWCFATGAPIANIQSYYPGDNSVSWASMDGYNKNTGTTGANQGPVASFYQIFNAGYNSIVGFTKRPILIAETGTVEFTNATDPTSKAQWITDAFSNTIPNDFPHIKAIDYFDSGNQTYDYKIDTSPASLSAIQQVYKSPLYQASAPTVTMSF